MIRPDHIVLPDDTASEQVSVGILALLHDVLVVNDSTDPLVEVVAALSDAGVTPRTIAKRLDVAERLVVYLQGLAEVADPKDGPRYEARRALQDMETGVVWPSGSETLQALPATWLNRDTCKPLQDGPTRLDGTPLVVLRSAASHPPPPQNDHLAKALDVPGAKLVGRATPVVVRARVVRTLQDVGMLGPFSGIAEPALRDLLHANAGNARVMDVIERVRSGEGVDHVDAALADFQSLAGHLAGKDGRLSAAQRRGLVDAARRVTIAVASELAADNGPAPEVFSLFARAETTAPKQVPGEAAPLLERLCRENDAAATAVASALDTIISRAEEHDHALLPLASQLLMGLMRARPTYLPADLPARDVRQSVAELREGIDELVTTLRRTELHDVA